MKKTSLLAFVVHLLCSMLCYSQSVEDLNGLKKTETIAPVPDAPAFNALGSLPSNILRPSDTKAFALSIAPFIQGGKFTLPKNFALEVSPAAFIYRDRRINIDDYRDKKVYLAYNTAFSVGTGLDSANALSKIAFGWRTTFINDADKFRSDEHRARIDDILRVGSQSFEKAWRDFKVAHGHEFTGANTQINGSFDIHLNYDEDLLSGPDSNLIKQFYTEYQNLAEIQKKVDAADKDFEKNHWNAKRLDAAAAFVLVDSASSGNLKANQIKTWLTYAAPINKYGQVVLGFFGAAGFEGVKSDSSGNIIHRPNVDFSAAMRIYAGNNKYKFFTELQVGAKQEEHIGVTKPGRIKNLSGLYPTNNFAIGTEIGIFNLAWVSLYGGVKDVGVNMVGAKTNHAYLRFEWKLTIPDWVKFRAP